MRLLQSPRARPGIHTRLLRPRGPRHGVAYWEVRAKRHGVAAVHDLRHDDAGRSAFTARQQEVLLPLLQDCLDGTERVVLDFGCGPGRFTAALADIVGEAIGVDPIQSFLDAAPQQGNVEYMRLIDGAIPLPDDSVDVVWVALVLGSLVTDEAVDQAVAEICRVLRPGGLIFLTENCSDLPDCEHVVFRSESEYASLFDPPLAVVGQYEYVEQMCVLAGRMP
jgi:SAM-dependent methyltransferase